MVSEEADLSHPMRRAAAAAEMFIHRGRGLLHNVMSECGILHLQKNLAASRVSFVLPRGGELGRQFKILLKI
jgi:hypothetical protein